MDSINWAGCYKRGWGNLLVPAAFAHPAKVSFLLAERIYDFLFEIGALAEGARVVDPFGGIAGFGLGAMKRGLDWTGVELEEKFVSLGNENIALWNSRYSALPRWGTARLLQGDSRNLAALLGADKVVATVSSPPYASNLQNATTSESTRKRISEGKYNGKRPDVFLSSGQTSKDTFGARYSDNSSNLGNLREGSFDAALSSPPYSSYALPANDGPEQAAARRAIAAERRITPDKVSSLDYRTVKQFAPDNPANLGNLREGSFDAALSSPPYADTPINPGNVGNAIVKNWGQGKGLASNHPNGYGSASGNLGNLKDAGFSAAISSPPYEGARIGGESGAANVGHNENYGSAAGQLGAMQGGDYDAAVSSPPYEGSVLKNADAETRNQRINAGRLARGEILGGIGRSGALGASSNGFGYGAGNGQLGETTGDTFWLASRQIVGQVHHVLKPQGWAVWVLKDFVRAKARVPFCEQWQTLCEHLGFETVYIARAWLVEEHGTQLAQDGNHRKLAKSRKSFFRRLNEKNGGPRIDFEVVLFMRKRA